MKFWTVQKIMVADTVNKFSMPPLMIMPPYVCISERSYTGTSSLHKI